MLSLADAQSLAKPPPRPADLARDLRLPVIVAPMFLVSGPALVTAAAKAGLIGAFPTANARTVADLAAWMETIEAELAPHGLSRRWGAGLIVHKSYDRFEDELALVRRHRPSLVVTALGDPRRAVEAVHGYGGQVFCDVVGVAQARKAVAAGVDGLILVCAGAGGHTGALSPFAFVDEVRRFWDGPVALAGSISDGRGVRAAQVLGADFAYMGTRFIAARESLASEAYRAMLVEAGAEDIVTSDALTGVKANWLKASLERARPADAVPAAPINFADIQGATKAWKHVWSAGQGVGAIAAVQSLGEIADELCEQYARAAAPRREPAAARARLAIA